MANPHSNTLEQLRHKFFATGDAGSLLATRSGEVDILVIPAYREFLETLFEGTLSVLAVGGYGRRELFPYSDVDLLLLISAEIKGDEKRAALAAFLRHLWDQGLRVSHSVRTVVECCELDSQNVELSVSLLDRRFLAGDQALYEQLESKISRFFERQGVPLIGHLCEMSRARHAKFHHTIFHQEPNIKETPGTIRDLHLIGWIRKLHQSASDEQPGLEEAREFLSALRCRLHFRAGRDNNALTFDAQQEIAAAAQQDVTGEEFMRRYYGHARSVFRYAVRQMDVGENLAEGSLLRQFKDWRSRLSNADFSVTNERAFFKSPQQIQSDPELVLRLYQFVARHGFRLALDTERRIATQRPLLSEYFSRSRPIWPLLEEIFSGPHVDLALRSMHDTGLLFMLFPEWRAIENLVIRDTYHRYTVDEHTLIAIETLRELAGSKDNRRRRFQDLLAELERPATLIAALLFHDTGKGSDGEHHALASVTAAKAAFERIQMPEELARRCLFLIEFHLVLSSVMNSRDLSDPKTARDLAETTRTVEDLKYLTLLTYADVSAVNPEAMTSWRLEQLWRVYVTAYQELTAELQTSRIEKAPPDLESFLAGFPTRYLRTRSEAEIRQHAELEKLSRSAGVAVDLRPLGGVYHLTVITPDHRNLFASMAGMLSSFGMNILKAEAFSNRSGLALDTFVFSDPMRTLELNGMEIERLKLKLQRTALGKEDVKRLLQGRPRPAVSAKNRLAPTVHFNSNVSDSATLVEIVTEDRPGLLYELAQRISEADCNIEVVLIDTEAFKALDVFYLTRESKKLTGDVQSQLRNELLAVCQPQP